MVEGMREDIDMNSILTWVLVDGGYEYGYGIDVVVDGGDIVVCVHVHVHVLLIVFNMLDVCIYPC
jgi:hypothetical protein